MQNKKEKVIFIDPVSSALPTASLIIKKLKKDFYLEVYCSETSYNQDFVEDLRSEINLNIFKISSTVTNSFYGALNYFRIIFSCLLKKHDIYIQFPNFFPLDIIFFLFAGKRINFIVHNLFPHEKTIFFKRNIFLSKLAKSVIFLSEEEKIKYEIYAKSTNTNTKTILWQLGPTPIIPDDSLRPYSQKHELEKPIITFCGNIKQYKGIDTFLNSYKSSKISRNFDLEVYGKIDANINKQIFIEFIKKDGFIENDHFKKLLINKKRIFILPYQEATQSGLFYNFLFYGSLMLVSDVGDMARRLKENDLSGIVFDPESISSFENALNYLLENYKIVIERLKKLQEDSLWN